MEEKNFERSGSVEGEEQKRILKIFIIHLYQIKEIGKTKKKVRIVKMNKRTKIIYPHLRNQV